MFGQHSSSNSISNSPAHEASINFDLNVALEDDEEGNIPLEEQEEGPDEDDYEEQEAKKQHVLTYLAFLIALFPIS
ncbi:hypothetical protein ABZP36_007479 [Zizania latifolia]